MSSLGSVQFGRVVQALYHEDDEIDTVEGTKVPRVYEIANPGGSKTFWMVVCVLEVTVPAADGQGKREGVKADEVNK